MKIDFNTKTTYGDDDKYIKTKIKTYKDSIITNFYNKKGSKKIPEEKIPHKYLWIIILDSILYAQEKYYAHIFLECKYVQEKIKTNNYIDGELKSELIVIVIVIMILILIIKNIFENATIINFNTIKPNSAC